MKIDIEKKTKGIVVLRPHGKIVSGDKVMTLKSTINDLIKDENVTDVIVDFSAVPFMDSTGLGVLIASYTTLKKGNRNLVLLKVADKIKDLLVVTKLLSLFDCYESESDAIKALMEKRKQ